MDILPYTRFATRALLPLLLALSFSACGGKTPEGASSSSSSSASSSTSSSSSSSSSSSASSASSSGFGDETLAQSNQYTAYYASNPPTIDGFIDNEWSKAPWQAVDVFWLGAQSDYPTPEDYSGRFKVLWDEGQIYLLMDITDDVIFDHNPDPLSQYWIDDTVEIFIDPDHSGGGHQYNNFDNAWAYHISTYLDVVDMGLSGIKLYNQHIDVQLHSEGNRHIWEMAIRIYDQGYDDNVFEANVPATLYSGKTMGFSASYIDNDDSLPASGYERESMMGSVDTLGHKDNRGYMDADVFGSLLLQ